MPRPYVWSVVPDWSLQTFDIVACVAIACVVGALLIMCLWPDPD